MTDQYIHSFIRDHLTRGVSSDETREVLLAAGWPEQDIQATFDEVSATQPALIAQADATARERTARKEQDARVRRKTKMVTIGTIIVVAVLLLGAVAWGVHMKLPAIARSFISQ